MAPCVATRSPAARPDVTAALTPSSGSAVTGRGSKRSGAVFTQTMAWFAGFFTSAATGTAMPRTVALPCTNTRTGWPTASADSAAPSARKDSGSACSRRLRAAPMKASGTRSPPMASVAPPMSRAAAASKASASMRSRAGSITSKISSRASTTCPATAWAEAITPETGAASVSRVDRPALTAAMRPARPCASLSAASMSLRGTVSASSRRRAARWSARPLAARSSASCAAWFERSMGAAEGTT